VSRSSSGRDDGKTARPHAEVKIALVSGNARVVGGIETYLRTVVPALRARGHRLAMFHETADPEDRPWITEDPGIPRFCAGTLGAGDWLACMREWAPDIVFNHGLGDIRLEGSAGRIAPEVYFAHGYFGTCISGAKVHRWPAPAPCSRRFGAACLGLYLPRRCGGLSPATMWREYRNSAERLTAIRRCRALVVTSGHMAEEYRRHGLGDRVQIVHLPVLPPSAGAGDLPLEPSGAIRLLFMGRMESLKGGRLLLDALPMVRAQSGRPVELCMAGDGPDRALWSRRAEEITRHHGGIRCTFAGWVEPMERDRLLRGSHLLVVPSIWPEPFGQVGLEAGHFGVPSAAFAVGGIPDWLHDGVNGHLAPADPPTAPGLAGAIGRCLSDPVSYAGLRTGARKVAGLFTLDRHLVGLERAFAAARVRTSAAPSPSEDA
jgi:glycosyltransferase involved in cell wall biosynthesis